ncbi:hypothetical protein [Streptomyces sp. NPDC051001]|uniref:hypothetical protein n=1 Tax=Streptomyces sp. NPDC051001 TaxID=3155795 RepID=UPI003436B444
MRRTTIGAALTGALAMAALRERRLRHRRRGLHALSRQEPRHGLAGRHLDGGRGHTGQRRGLREGGRPHRLLHAHQNVSLQFRRPGTDYYEPLGYVETNTYGVATAKGTVSADRYWRYYFRGTMTTGAAKAPGDFVDVR